MTKVFRYTWDSHAMGISTTDPATGTPIAPGTAFFTTEDWLSGARWGRARTSASSCAPAYREVSGST